MCLESVFKSTVYKRFASDKIELLLSDTTPALKLTTKDTIFYSVFMMLRCMYF